VGARVLSLRKMVADSGRASRADGPVMREQDTKDCAMRLAETRKLVQPARNAESLLGSAAADLVNSGDAPNTRTATAPSPNDALVEEESKDALYRWATQQATSRESA
jgi:hypothetical protein